MRTSKAASAYYNCQLPYLFYCMYNFYTPNGYIVPAEFGVHFLSRMKNVPKGTQLHLNEIGLTNNEFEDKFD